MTTISVPSPIATECVSVSRSKDQVDLDLRRFGHDVQVVASRMTEDGFELILEGPANQVADLVWLWNQEVFI